MKPERKKKKKKKNRANSSNNGAMTTASCYEFTKLSQELDVMEGKPTEAASLTLNVKDKEANCNSCFDLTKLSKELSAVEEKVALGVKVENWKEDIKLKQRRMHLLSLYFLDLLEEESKKPEFPSRGSLRRNSF